MQIFIDIGGKPHSAFLQYLIQKTAQSSINNYLSLVSLLHASTPTGSSSGKCILMHTSIENSVKICSSRVETNYSQLKLLKLFNS